VTLSDVSRLLSRIKRHYLSFFDRFPAAEFLFLGILSGLTLFPLPGIQIVLFFTVSRSLYLLDFPLPWKQFFLRIWALGLGFFCASLYWICQAMFVEIEVFWWAIPLCFLGIPAFMALITTSLSLWFLGWSYIAPSKILKFVFLQFGYAKSKSVSRLIMFASWWVFGEYFLSDFCTGFPWSLIGYTWSPVLVVAQLSSLGSVYTLSFLTLCVAGIPYLYYSKSFSSFRSFYVKFSAALILGILIFGSVRLLNKTEYTDTTVRLVQPCIPHAVEWKILEQLLNLNKLIRLSQSDSQNVDAVIWPEAAIGFYLEEGSALQLKLGQSVGKKSRLILGAIKRDVEKKKNWNSIYVLNHKGEIEATYDKHHLVPFGEYVPLRHWIEKILPKDKVRKVTMGILDFSEGGGPKTVTVPRLPSFSPIICYEAIFPGQVTQKKHRPKWLLHFTNDSWFGTSVGPYQHFQIARMRAIEEGLPLVRVSNTGISGVIDPYGRILKKIDLGVVGAADVQLPKPIPTPPFCYTFFSVMDWFDQFDPFSSRRA
jgi:apolipoprotein N-acyltransferase